MCVLMSLVCLVMYVMVPVSVSVMLSDYVPRYAFVPVDLPYVVEIFSKYPFTCKLCQVLYKHVNMYVTSKPQGNLNNWLVNN